MGSLSITHLILLLVIVLIFFGPSRLPGLAKALGESIRGFKKGMEGLEEDDETRKQLAAKEKRELPGSSQGSNHGSSIPKKDEHKG